MSFLGSIAGGLFGGTRTEVTSTAAQDIAVTVNPTVGVEVAPPDVSITNTVDLSPLARLAQSVVSAGQAQSAQFGATARDALTLAAVGVAVVLIARRRRA